MTIKNISNSVRVMTWNSCAEEYIHYLKKSSLSHQPYVIAQDIDSRHKDIAKKITASKADVVCLQEVSRIDLFRKHLSSQFKDVYEKRPTHPDGVAILYNPDKVDLVGKQVVHYKDANSMDATGKAALFVQLRLKATGDLFWIATTHFQGGIQNAEIQKKQVQTFVSRVKQIPLPVIACGDFNFLSTDPIMKTFNESGLKDPLQGVQSATAWHGNGAQRIDYICSSLQPKAISVDGNFGSFMTSQEPSDHLRIIADYEIASPLLLHNKDEEVIFEPGMENINALIDCLEKGRYSEVQKKLAVLPKQLQEGFKEAIWRKKGSPDTGGTDFAGDLLVKNPGDPAILLAAKSFFCIVSFQQVLKRGNPEQITQAFHALPPRIQATLKKGFWVFEGLPMGNDDFGSSFFTRDPKQESVYGCVNLLADNKGEFIDIKTRRELQKVVDFVTVLDIRQRRPDEVEDLIEGLSTMAKNWIKKAIWVEKGRPQEMDFTTHLLQKDAKDPAVLSVLDRVKYIL